MIAPHAPRRQAAPARVTTPARSRRLSQLADAEVAFGDARRSSSCRAHRRARPTSTSCAYAAPSAWRRTTRRRRRATPISRPHANSRSTGSTGGAIVRDRTCWPRPKGIDHATTRRSSADAFTAARRANRAAGVPAATERACAGSRDRPSSRRHIMTRTETARRCEPATAGRLRERDASLAPKHYTRSGDVITGGPAASTIGGACSAAAGSTPPAPSARI